MFLSVLKVLYFDEVKKLLPNFVLLNAFFENFDSEEIWGVDEYSF